MNFFFNNLALGWVVANLTHPIACSGACKMPPVKQVIWHSGSLTGVTTLLAILPEQDFVIAILSNLGFNSKIFDMMQTIIKNFAL